jgi:hypothetical protein
MDIGYLFERVCRSLLARLNIVTVFDISMLSGIVSRDNNGGERCLS